MEREGRTTPEVGRKQASVVDRSSPKAKTKDRPQENRISVVIKHQRLKLSPLCDSLRERPH